MKFIFSALVFFSSPLSVAASMVHTTAALLCEETGKQPVKVRIALVGRGTGRSALILKHGADQDVDTVLHSDRISDNETSVTAFRTTMRVDGRFEWVWIRKPGTPGYKGTLEIFTPINQWPANSPAIEMNCSLDEPLSYFL